MLVFPQLSTGVVTEYPVTKQSLARTVVNAMGDGSTVVFADPDAAATAWQLKATGLTAAEFGGIETLFAATSGMWQTFTFLDPVGNLLANSEDFSAGSWANGALIELTPAVGDPLGTSRATRVINAGAAAESVAQTLAVPGNFTYCISVWARTIGTSSVTLAIGTLTKTFALSSNWARVSMSGNLGTSATSVTFGAQLGVGASVDLFGMQVEAQPSFGDYKITGRGGVYSRARFSSDRFTVTAQGTDSFDVTVGIVDTEG
ncbi:MAG TPA: hypothetical protein VKR43_14540 [Bryobacteraceae bacterium]|nr:hypothetical protein [Bryobacteraceae bacterium]